MSAFDISVAQMMAHDGATPEHEDGEDYVAIAQLEVSGVPARIVEVRERAGGAMVHVITGEVVPGAWMPIAMILTPADSHRFDLPDGFNRAGELHDGH